MTVSKKVSGHSVATLGCSVFCAEVIAVVAGAVASSEATMVRADVAISSADANMASADATIAWGSGFETCFSAAICAHIALLRATMFAGKIILSGGRGMVRRRRTGGRGPFKMRCGGGRGAVRRRRMGSPRFWSSLRRRL